MDSEQSEDPGRDEHGRDESTRRPGESGLETATRGQGDERDPASQSETWGRFQRVQLLGEGGMGRVYEAWDPHLQRRVALKVLRSSRPTAVERFLREARTQARLEHPGICPIYEVGETDSGPYIVMRLIEGRTLAEAAGTMTLEEKLLVLAEVASAVHEAHRAGLIHRDLKPSNIMVEAPEDGRRQVFVMDFGIARAAAEASDLTAEGTFLGTPAYASPEQVRGESTVVDRRSDVYSLGATLYSLIAGGPPFTGTSSAVMMDVLTTPPKPLRPLGIPRDVDTIVMTCLAKEADLRYASARDLAEDLRRFLDGDPIAARPVGPITRAVKWVRKNRLAASIAAVAMVLVLALAAWGGSTRWRAGIRERVVRDLSAQVEGLEAEVRFSRMAPAHDVRADRARLRDRMATIAAQIAELGAIAEGPGHYALGRAHLALGDLNEARRHLELAREAAPEDARVAQALGLTLSRQYRRELAEVQALASPELRARHRAELQQALRDPAIRAMQDGMGVTDEADRYLRALIAFHRGDFTGALDALESASAPWFFEAELLRGDILSERAQQQTDAIGPGAAEEGFDRAIEAYTRAQEIAPSNPDGFLSAGHVASLQMLAHELSDTGGLEYQPKGLAWAERARALDPEDPRPLHLIARLHHREAESLRNRAEDPTEPLTAALAAAERAVELSDDDSAAWLELAVIHTSRALVAGRQGPDAQRRVLAEVKAALDRVKPAEQGYRYFNAMGVYHLNRARLRESGGGDATAEYELAADSFRRAVAIHPRGFETQANFFVVLTALAREPDAEDRVGTLEEAAEAMEVALDGTPSKAEAYAFHLGQCCVLIAQDGDPMTDRLDPEWAGRAMAAYERGLAKNPEFPYLIDARAGLVFLQARQAWDAGDDPEPLLTSAGRQLESGIGLAPRHSYFHLNLAWVDYFRGKFAVREGRDGQAPLREAIRRAEHALTLRPSDRATLCVGSAHRMLAEAAFLAGADPRPQLARAHRAFAEVLEHNPRHDTAHRAAGRCFTLEARWLVQSGGDPGDAFAAAEASMTRALQIHPQAPSVTMAEARRCLREAGWRQAAGSAVDALVERGLEHADRALSVRPGLPEARAIRSHLELVLATGHDRARALADLEEALMANPHLEFEWGLHRLP